MMLHHEASVQQAREEEEELDHHGDPMITSPLLRPTTSGSSPENGEEEENSPVEQVTLTVPVSDEPETPVLTFRMWVLGTASCAVLSFLNQFFWYRKEPLTITAISAQIAVVPLGRLMAATLPEHAFFRGRPWEFTLNPGPFNVKEHVLITIFANSGAGTVYAIHLITGIRVFYGKPLSFFISLLVVLTTQMLGFGWAGIFRRYLVEPASMWWPSNLVQVSLFSALHEKEARRKGGLTRNQFFLVAFVCSFAYYIFPGYLFQMLTSLSWICWVFPSSVLAQQLGSGLRGLGVGAIGLDWSSISSYLGSPLASPWFATVNVGVGFFFIMYIITSIAYWFNFYKAQNFPIFSDGLFTSTQYFPSCHIWCWFCNPCCNNCSCSPLPWKEGIFFSLDSPLHCHQRSRRGPPSADHAREMSFRRTQFSPTSNPLKTPRNSCVSPHILIPLTPQLHRPQLLRMKAVNCSLSLLSSISSNSFAVLTAFPLSHFIEQLVRLADEAALCTRRKKGVAHFIEDLPGFSLPGVSSWASNETSADARKSVAGCEVAGFNK